MLPCLIRKFGRPWYLLFLHLSNGFVIEPETRYIYMYIHDETDVYMYDNTNST